MAVLYFGRHEDRAPQAQAPESQAAASPAPLHQAGSGVAPSGASLAATPQMVGDQTAGLMGRRFAAATNYREFVSYALAHPELGGRYYAHFTLSRCTQARGSLGQAPGIDAQGPRAEALAGIQRVVDACDGLEEQFGGIRHLARLANPSDPSATPDPLQAAQRQLSVEKDPERALQIAMATGDPQIQAQEISTRGPVVVLLRHPEIMTQTSAQVVRMAGIILGCEVGDICRDMLAMEMCVHGGCESLDLRDQVLSKMTDEERRQVERLLALMRAELLPPRADP